MLKKLYPEKLRTRIMLLSIALVCISTFTIAYLVEKQGRDLLLQEKEQKLFAVAHVLDVELDNIYQTLDSNQSQSKEQKIAYLNKLLAPKLEQILAKTPKVAAGYYHKALDAIIVYAPQEKFGSNMGISIALEHPGREVMQTGQPLVWFGQQVRGNIMNAMIPIIRNNKILGYIWANELIEDINAQTVALNNRIILVCLIGLVCSIILTLLLSRRLNTDIDIIKQHLNELPFNLQIKLPPLQGEMNEIVNGVNHLSSALNEARSINEMILDSTIDGIITVDNNGLITMLNPAAQRITGYALNEVIGKPYDSIIDDKSFESPLLDTLHNGNDHMGVEIDFPVSGKIYQISSSTSHLRNQHGEIIGAVVIFKDLTEQKEIQRVMQQTERLVVIGELMAGVAHEIRNPLTAIRGFVQYLQKKDASKEKKDEYIAIILQEVDSINKVIQQLLDFSKPHKNYFYHASLNQLIRDTLLIVETSKSSPHIKFVLNLDEDLEPIYLDKSMIKQVLLNLIINAVQAIPDQGTITITTYLAHNKPMQCVEIRDTGIGFSEETRNTLFTPFFTTKPSGTGLGLSIVEKIITSHQGSIQINNHKEGGAVITVSLPMT